jgi:hypothetical protein
MHTSRPTRILARAFSVALAAVLTVGMLGGIDALSQPDAQMAQWAHGGDTQRG